MMATRAVLAGLLTLSACGDDGGSPNDAAVDAGITATDVEGTWLMASLTLPDQGTLVTLLRDGMPQGLRGDVVVTATGAATATLRVRQAILMDGLLASDIDAFDIPVVLEPDRWILTEPEGGVMVFTMALTGDHLVLTLDPDDPRVTATDPPHAIVLDRVTPWTTTTAGEWVLVSLTNASGTIPGDVCTAAGGGWFKVHMAITISDRQMFERVMTTTSYSDDTCTTLVNTQTSAQLGYGEEEGGNVLRIWGVEDDNEEYLAFALSQASGALTLTRTACLPQPACEDEAPTRVVVRRP